MYVMNVRVLLMYLRVCVKFYENLFVKCFILYVIKLCIVLMNRLNKNYNVDYNILDILYQMCLYMYIFLGYMYFDINVFILLFIC